MALELRLRRKAHTFKVHTSSYFGSLYLAANVKFKRYEPLSNDYQFKYNKIIADSKKTESDLHQLAFELTQEYWWLWAKQTAERLNLGEIVSAGKSGGWLVMKSFPLTDLQLLANDNFTQCKHCDKSRSKHVDFKCLYEPNYYYPLNDSDWFRVLKAIRFTHSCERSLDTWVPNEYTHQLEYLIDEMRFGISG